MSIAVLQLLIPIVAQTLKRHCSLTGSLLRKDSECRTASLDPPTKLKGVIRSLKVAVVPDIRELFARGLFTLNSGEILNEAKGYLLKTSPALV